MAKSNQRNVQRLVLVCFIFTFISARLLVLLIMSRTIPDFYLHLGGTHVHHLNYGIFLLASVGAILLFKPTSSKKWLEKIAILYGVGLALTFDEFGMWLHLGGSYWQRGSFDALITITSILLLLAYMPPLKDWTKRKVAIAVLLTAFLAVFFWRLSIVLPKVEHEVTTKLKHLESQGSQ